MERNYQIVNQNGRAKLSKKNREAVQAFFAANGQALVKGAKDNYREALAPYRKACRKAGIECQFEGGRFRFCLPIGHLLFRRDRFFLLR